MRLLLLATLLGALAGCGTDDVDGAGGADGLPPEPAPSGAASSSPPLSSTDLPTTSHPTTPPTTPSDVFASRVEAGTVSVGKAGCTMLVTERGVAFALRGEIVEDLPVGAFVKLAGRGTNAYDERCAATVFGVTELVTPSKQ